MKWESAKWFTLSGILVCLSQMFLYMAMSIAPVTVISPINRLSILFRLYFSRLLNPEHEMFGGGVIVGTLVSLTGALALALSVDALANLLPLPAAVARAAALALAVSSIPRRQRAAGARVGGADETLRRDQDRIRRGGGATFAHLVAARCSARIRSGDSPRSTATSSGDH